MTKINALDWINTKFSYKLIRMLVAVVFYLGIEYLFVWLSVDSQSSEAESYFYKAVPMFLYGYVIYGPLVVLMEKIGLITRQHYHAHLLLS